MFGQIIGTLALMFLTFCWGAHAHAKCARRLGVVTFIGYHKNGKRDVFIEVTDARLARGKLLDKRPATIRQEAEVTDDL